MSKALIIFAKRPSPGRVKTRLFPHLAAEEAAELYRRMLFDVLAKTGQMTDVDKFLFYEQGAGAAEYFAETACGGCICPQVGEGMGERLEAAFDHVFRQGYSVVAAIGTDSPDLPVPFVERAFELLRFPDVDAVFGPAGDGGYYLVAMNRLHRGLFRDIPWSTGEVLERSQSRAAAAGVAIALLPLWHDVDTAADLLRPELVDPNNGAPLTRDFILRHQLRSPVFPGGR